MKRRLAPNTALDANNQTKMYTVVVPICSIVSFNILNSSAADVQVSVWISSSNTPTDADLIEKLTLTANGSILERSELVMSRDEMLFIEASGPGVSVRVWGDEILE